jgi:truncated hemoglobin YjbI
VNTTTILIILVFLAVCASAAVQFATYRALMSIINERKADLEEFQRGLEDGQITEVQSAVVESDVEETQQLKIVGQHPRPPFPAPMVGGETVKQWMIHLYNNDNIWSMFTDSFYIRVTSNPLVKPLFAGKDLADIKRKFLATLLIMCDKGVSEAAAATLIKMHEHLNMSEGAYNAVMTSLEDTLVQYRVPEETIAQFVPMIDYFRDEMVAA